MIFKRRCSDYTVVHTYSRLLYGGTMYVSLLFRCHGVAGSEKRVYTRIPGAGGRGSFLFVAGLSYIYKLGG